MKRRLVRLGAAALITAVCGAALPRPAFIAEAASFTALPVQPVLVMLKLSAEHFRAGGAYGGDYGDLQLVALRRSRAREIARRHGLRLRGEGWAMPLIGVDCYLMEASPDRRIQDVIADVEREPAVAWSQPLQTFHAERAAAFRPDPLFNVQPAAKLWRLASLHRLAIGRGAVVAVVDSKVDVRHLDLDGQVVVDQDFVDPADHPERHGTGVAGVIAAKEGDGVGIAGVAPGAKLMALRACHEKTAALTVCDSLSLAKALHFAIEANATAINLSLSGPNDRLLARLLSAALARRLAVVSAYDPHATGGGFPADYPGVIAVAAEEGARPHSPDVFFAPGQDVPTTEPGGWALADGSSFAAAHVSGLIALVHELHPSLAPHALLASVGWVGGAFDPCAVLLHNDKACGGATTSELSRR